ncbi:MAG: glycosyl transferase family 2 [Candidatus Altiarchaeales archaeon WOR_SM1_79]|nr:MAG: glycosyl transferase family 2 [Candidatus Altiarchaeales archaeon WOR_SM1_79]
MKVVVTVPAYNEEANIGGVIKEIPRNIDGVDCVDVLVVDDGSTDSTVQTAEDAKADNIVCFKQNMGLSQAFKKGLETALEMDADIIVNIDADGQYNGREIPKLIKPILDDKADMVLGIRSIDELDHMPMQKKIGNKIATFVTRFVSGFPVSDAQTGFRAFSREAALKLNILSEHTYVQETIIQAVNKGLKIVEVPIEFRRRDGRSRLISNIFGYAAGAGMTIIRTYRDHKPLKVFIIIGGFIFIIGFLFGIGILIEFIKTGFVPRKPLAILSSILMIIGFQVIIFGLLADMLDSQRKLIEEILYKEKKHEIKEMKLEKEAEKK